MDQLLHEVGALQRHQHGHHRAVAAPEQPTRADDHVFQERDCVLRLQLEGDPAPDSDRHGLGVGPGFMSAATAVASSYMGGHVTIARKVGTRILEPAMVGRRVEVLVDDPEHGQATITYV